ncbi:MAG: hypothetical protein ACLR0U_19130 [Enterocloster clostridioformis]
MKKWEKKFKGSFISFKAGKKPQHEEEYPVKYGIEALEVEGISLLQSGKQKSNQFIKCAELLPVLWE